MTENGTSLRYRTNIDYFPLLTNVMITFCELYNFSINCSTNDSFGDGPVCNVAGGFRIGNFVAYFSSRRLKICCDLKRFQSAVDSDAVWDRFLPSDWSEVLSRSASPVVYATKKELYSSLCNSPILLDAGNLSFSLDKMSGKKCYMVGSRDLNIVWSNAPEYWEWTPRADLRFSQVAELKDVCRLDIRGKVKTQMLSCDTTYGAYLVFNLAEEFYGLESAIAVVRIVNDDGFADVEERIIVVRLQRTNARYDLQDQNEMHPVRRDDGWMEVEMGRFYNGQRDDSEAEAQLWGIDAHHWKSGLIVEGIEFRPIMTFYRPQENDEGESRNMIR